MFFRDFTSKHLLSLIKCTTCTFILCCLAYQDGFAHDLTEDETIINLDGSENINIHSYTLTLDNTNDTVFYGGISGTGKVIKKGSGQLTLARGNGYASFTGSVTVQEGTLNLTGWKLFRSNSPPSIINNGTIIADGGGQVLHNLSGSGNLQIAADTMVTSSYEQDSVISGIISGSGSFTKDGSAALTLSGANTLSGRMVISNGKICFTGDAIVASGPIEGRSNGNIEYNVTGGTKILYIPDDSKHILVKNIVKTGDDTLQIYEEAKGCVSAESFVISSGRVDYGGYFQSVVFGGGAFDVEDGTILSPGLSVDENGVTINTIGDMVISNGVNLTIKSGATALFEFDAYNEDLTLQNYDKIITEEIVSSFSPEFGSTIDLAFLYDDAWKWAKEDAEYHIVHDYGFANGEYDYLLPDEYRSYFSLVGKNNDGLYLIGLGAPEPPTPPTPLSVPEPSSWMLMAGSAMLFLFFLRKKRD